MALFSCVIDEKPNQIIKNPTRNPITDAAFCFLGGGHCPFDSGGPPPLGGNEGGRCGTDIKENSL